MNKDEEMSLIDKLLDENNNENVILFDENNQPVEFEQIAMIPLDEVAYFILKPVKLIEGMEENEALVFKLEENDEEEMIVICDDTQIIDKVFQEYYDLLKEEGLN